MFMQFSDTSANTGLVQDTDFFASTDAVSYPVADKARSMNRHWYKVVSEIIRVAGRWPYDDSNLATLPKVDLTMVEGTNEVLLPEANFKIYAVEVKDTAGKWVRIHETDFADKQNTISSFTTSSGFPTQYDMVGAYIYLNPAPTSTKVTLTSGLRVWVSREVDIFVAADTTQEPGFAEPFHRILSLGAAWDYLLVNGPTDKLDRIAKEYETLMENLRVFYSAKNQDIETRIRPVHRTEDYL